MTRARDTADRGYGLTAINTASIAASTTLAAGDSAKTLLCTAYSIGLTLPLASAAGAGWFVIVKNDTGREANASGGNVTVYRAGTDTIDTQTSLVIQAGLAYMILCDGTTFKTIKVGGKGFINVTSGTAWVCPAGVHQAKITCIGGGGGGGGGHATVSNGSGGGSGGAGAMFSDLVPGTSYTTAIGAAGAAGAIGGNGGSGGNTTFAGSNITAGPAGYGGASGSPGSSSATTITAGGSMGGGGPGSNGAGFGIYGAAGGASMGAANGFNYGGPGWVVNGNLAGMGGNGGGVGSTGSAGYAGAIIIEY